MKHLFLVDAFDKKLSALIEALADMGMAGKATPTVLFETESEDLARVLASLPGCEQLTLDQAAPQAEPVEKMLFENVLAASAAKEPKEKAHRTRGICPNCSRDGMICKTGVCLSCQKKAVRAAKAALAAEPVTVTEKTPAAEAQDKRAANFTPGVVVKVKTEAEKRLQENINRVAEKARAKELSVQRENGAGRLAGRKLG